MLLMSFTTDPQKMKKKSPGTQARKMEKDWTPQCGFAPSGALNSGSWHWKSRAPQGIRYPKTNARAMARSGWWVVVGGVEVEVAVEVVVVVGVAAGGGGGGGGGGGAGGFGEVVVVVVKSCCLW